MASRSSQDKSEKALKRSRARAARKSAQEAESRKRQQVLRYTENVKQNFLFKVRTF